MEVRRVIAVSCGSQLAVSSTGELHGSNSAQLGFHGRHADSLRHLAGLTKWFGHCRLPFIFTRRRHTCYWEPGSSQGAGLSVGRIISLVLSIPTVTLVSLLWELQRQENDAHLENFQK